MILLAASILAETLLHGSPIAGHPGRRPWCPYYPQFPCFAGGEIIFCQPEMIGEVDVLVHKTNVEVDRELGAIPFVKRRGRVKGNWFYFDRRGFEVELMDKEFRLGGDYGPYENAVNQRMKKTDCVVLVRRRQDSNREEEWLVDNGRPEDKSLDQAAVTRNSSLPPATGLITRQEIEFKGDRYVVHLTLTGNETQPFPGVILNHAYLEERELFSKTILRREPPLVLPPPSPPLGKSGVAHFTLVFPYKRSPRPVRHYFDYWCTWGDRVFRYVNHVLYELDPEGQRFFTAGEKIVGRPGNFMLEGP